MTLFLANTRVREEREGDLRAQIAALSVGSERLLAIVKTSGRKTVEAAMDGLKDYAERLMMAALKELPSGTYRAEDFLDDDGFGTGPIPIRVAIKIGRGKAVVDFTGSPPQRFVDFLFRPRAKAAPHRIPAASSGSMSILPVGGFARFRDRHFSYYETIAGGAGAAKGRPGASGIHTHMTNTLNTPIEALEAYYPMRITEYRIRPGSGGIARARGGARLIRDLSGPVHSTLTRLT